MTNRIKEVLDGILTKFESGDIPKAVAISTFPMNDMPSSRWSFLNRLIMYLSGTVDARGFRQWQQVGRSVKGGSKAFYIMVPRITRKETEKDEEEQIVSGFLAKPVFKYEDTAGKPLKIKTPKLPDLPLMRRQKNGGSRSKRSLATIDVTGISTKPRQRSHLPQRKSQSSFTNSHTPPTAKSDQIKTALYGPKR